MRSMLIPVLLISLFVCSSVSFAEEQMASAPPSLQAGAALLIDAKSGTILYEKNAEERMYPASITKIITGIMALESGRLDELVTVSKEARYEDGTRVYLAEGEQVPLENLVYALMLNSGNDAATAIAEHLAGSKAAFSEQMNLFVQEQVGVVNTHFMNPHGLPDPEHYTTASDMAKITQYALRNEKFREIVATQKMPWNGKEWQSQLENHNKLLTTYEGAIGVKNGFTQAAGFTLVSAANRDGFELIAVILKSDTNKNLYAEMTKLLDYGFEAFEPKQLFQAGQTYNLQQEDQEPLQFVADDEIWTAVPKQQEATVQIGPTGAITMTSADRTWMAGQLTYVQPESADAHEVSALSVSAAADERTGEEPSAWTVPIAGAWLLMLLMLAAVGAMKINRQKQKRSRRVSYDERMR
ncbi:D-alanyl-D-alanine carboxypeptidase [Paenibacillus phyllosphaerae]|uniref:D-alanyl-D-alanine carboxypeptidase n=2 Tax=Paenibacillus phyllosphaerae TaxID=274593 RepID=A0A7W5B3D0_9BACL|nr:D-alanyl-D-alanine carboxypeptidase [Paenibacillus phyllosphaerae]